MRWPEPALHTTAPVRLDSLTGARFIAALGVFSFHAMGAFPGDSPFGRALAFVGRDGGFGVTFFFVLSGFVLAWSWRPGGSTTSFYRRRFARIAPAYWVAFIYGLLWVFYAQRTLWPSTLNAVPAVLGIQAWFPDPAKHFAANGVEWSVSAELFFYAMFPVLVRIAHSRVGRYVLTAAAVLLAFVAPVALRLVLPPEIVSWALNILPAMRIGEFTCGLLLAIALREGRRLLIRPTVAAAIFFACYFFLPMSPSWVPQGPIFLASVLTVIASLAGADLRGRRTLVASPVLVRLGEWSYCFYLVHQMTTQITLRAAQNLLPGQLVGPIWLVVSLGLSVALAAALYSLVERPFERRLRGTTARSAARPLPASADRAAAAA